MNKTEISSIIQTLQQELDQASSPKSKARWESYMKHVISFRGVSIPKIRELLGEWRINQQLDQLSKDEELTIALAFFKESLAEDKLAGVLYLQEYLLPQFEGNELLPKFVEIYQKNLIFDWNVCDWFCVRVLGPGIQIHGRTWAMGLANWKDATNLWQARSALVPFVKVVRDNKYYPLIRIVGETLIQREERFAKTAVGWVLRDISKHEKDFVIDFLKKYLKFFTSETLRNTTKHFDFKEQNKWLQKLKMSNTVIQKFKPKEKT